MALAVKTPQPEKTIEPISCEEEFEKEYLRIINKVIDYLDEILSGTGIDYEFIEADKDPVIFDYGIGYLIIDAIFYKGGKEIKLPVLKLILEECRDGYRIIDYKIVVRKEDLREIM